MAGSTSFLNNTRDEIIREWRLSLERTRSGHETPPVLAHASELLGLVAELTQNVAAGQSLDKAFDIARASTRAFSRSADLGSIGPQLSALRGAIVKVWLKMAASRRDDDELRAIDAAIDALIVAAVSRHEEGVTEAFERLAAEREYALGTLESLLAASPVGIAFLDRGLCYLRINDALAALNGRPAAEHIGRPIAAMIPDAAPMLEPLLHKVMDSGQPALNIELQRATNVVPGVSPALPSDLVPGFSRAPQPSSAGEPRTYLATFFPVRAASNDVIGVGGIVLDVTETRRAERDLRRTQEQMQAILEHTPASIWIKDASGRIVLANHRLAEALGHPYEQIIGRRSDELLPQETADQHRVHDLYVAHEGRAIEAEETVPGPDGVRTFLSIKFPLPGEPPMVGGIATEISDRKRMEEELRVSVRARDSVLAAVSHDLRSPLQTIQLAAATLLGHLGPDQGGRRYLQIIHRSCLRMEHLITDLLDMASIAEGRLSVEKHAELADDIVREAGELHQPLASERKIALVQRPGADGVLVECDRQRILQVFENLVGNALKFCRAADTVTVGSALEDGHVRFWVEDTGPGIPPDLLPHLFDPYRSGPDSPGGIGLGLYIARGIVERHGGIVDVASALGRGTRFSFTIPAR